MVFLFKDFHMAPILRGEKTQTRRLHKHPRRVGSIHQCRTTLFGQPFARIRIKRVWQERLCDISVEDALAEGGYTPEEYIRGMLEMHEKRGLQRTDLVWCYEFEVV
ncbi:MAG: hypothetical protein DRH24_17710 [Deltaproteobacteria bacterium]|nr:MAG: hypothetical protein DRH24_17710 [Deltaproteobacteria bacterium]